MMGAAMVCADPPSDIKASSGQFLLCGHLCMLVLTGRIRLYSIACILYISNTFYMSSVFVLVA
jgi:hypothetical protein